MKKALIVGGSSGIGLALAKSLQQKGYFTYIVANSEPEHGVLVERDYKFYRSDLYSDIFEVGKCFIGYNF